MSIILHTGIPGSGKTYFVVHELMKSGVQDKYYVLHNIKGLKPEYFNEHVKDWTMIAGENPTEFFTVPAFEKIVEESKQKFNKAILLIVDEAWEYFEKITDENMEWFSWHRHIGMDIWLITQDASDLHRSVRKRAEYEITGNKSSVIDHFVYTYKANRTQFRVRKLKKLEAVFAAYKSFDFAGAKKPKSRLLQIAMAAAVLAVVGLVYGLGWAVPSMFANQANQSRPLVAKDLGTGGTMDDRTKPAVVQKSVKSGSSGVDWSKYTLAAVFGKTASLQDESGRLIRLVEILPKARVLEYEDGCAWIFTGKTGPDAIETVCKKTGFVKVEQRGGMGGRGGEPKATPHIPAASERLGHDG